MYIYLYHEDHSLYITTVELTRDEIYCDACSDYDELIGEFNTTLEAKELLDNLIKERNYDSEYALNFFKEEVLPYFNKNKEKKLKPEK